ncbi:MAG TPA: DUF6785 family protein [Chthonomonadaceae bacterium]|nr:DUF6785 family protein [Chthonomonadaceae bacterium]
MKRAPERTGLHPGLTWRSLLVAVGLTVLAGLWVRQSEIVSLSTQITESIPAIPGLAALALLLLVNVFLRRLPGAPAFSRAELAVVFVFVTISSTVMGIGVMQFLLTLITAPFYFTGGGIPKVRPLLPKWLTVQDPEAIRRFYEGSPPGPVPWHLWWKPGLCWLGFFLALWWTMYCLMALFYRAWAEEERLSFPLVSLPIEMTGGESGTGAFFRNKLMWLGFSLAAVYNLVNIAHAFAPSLPPFGKDADMSPLFTTPPWSEIAPIMFHFRPELIGLGFLVSTEISLTVWVSFVAMKLGSVFGVAMGYQPGRLPYAQEQGIGAYLVLAAMLVWLTRRHLRAAWQAALRGDHAGPEGIRFRWAFVGLFGGFLAVWGFATAAGIAWWVSLAYLAIVLAVALVYGRLRAEAGVPLVWLFPFYMQKTALLYTLGSQPFAASSPTTLPTWSLFTFLARGYFPAMTGYQVEGMELARQAKIDARKLVLAACLAVGLGFVLGWYNHLVPYYLHGAQQLRGGIWGEWIAVPEYQQAASLPGNPRMPTYPRIWATCFGGIIVFALWLLRLRFAGFWFHPLGYAMTCSYGDLIWGSFLIVWLIKALILRYGGMPLYRKAVPFFLGFALGHFAIAGILWGLTGTLSGAAEQGYPVFFG